MRIVQMPLLIVKEDLVRTDNLFEFYVGCAAFILGYFVRMARQSCLAHFS